MARNRNQRPDPNFCGSEEHKGYFTRRSITRRTLFEVLGAGVTGAFMTKTVQAQDASQAPATPINKAKNVVFILLAGAPSHTDLFDFKNIAGTTPAAAKAETINGVLWPTGILPKLGQSFGDLAIIRSMRSHASRSTRIPCPRTAASR